MLSRRSVITTGVFVSMSLLSGCMYRVSEDDSDYIASYNFQESDPVLHIRFRDTASLSDLSHITIEHPNRGIWSRTDINPDLARQSVEYPRDQTPAEIEEHKLVLYGTDEKRLEEHYLVLPERMREPRE